MAGAPGHEERAVGTGDAADAVRALEQALAAEPSRFNFFQVLRRLEVAFRDRPRIGEANRASEEVVRLGQEPALGFPPGALAGYTPRDDAAPGRLAVNFLGLLGPNGPMPLHLTEHARERILHHGDRTFARFLDIFHHRMLSLFYRAWAAAQPVVGRDRPESDRFPTYVGALCGVAGPAFQNRDLLADTTKLFLAGRLGAHAHNAEGLGAVIRTALGVPVEIEEFVGDWMTLPEEARWRLGPRDDGGRLGRTTVAGARIFDRTAKFRVVLGPLPRAQFDRMLPGGDGVPELVSIVRSYVGEELAWDVRVVLDEQSGRPLTLGASRVGYDTWLGQRPAGSRREDVIVNPEQVLRDRRRHSASKRPPAEAPFVAEEAEPTFA